MESLIFSNNKLRILCLGAHCDDIEIGMGGTLLKLIASGSVEQMTWVIFSSNPQREKEFRDSAAFFLKDVSNKNIIVHSFPDGRFPSVMNDLKESFEQLKTSLDPDIIFTHYRHDLHQDHRCLNEITWNTWRDHLILEYEILKYDGDMGSPNCYVSLDNETANIKADSVYKFYLSQQTKKWFRPEVFLGMMTVRGVEIQSGFAEAFYSRKFLLM